ncbi:hypothetical protein BD626DRAFT_31779 [Schizophyllum amplum]|uniref:MYND-type domain-containing protein n=1 Tax=Schizophyllum amplum TaxID=97359 RepID=A0A550D0W2_9AGAR|nr:hypothetical protein BD626DRAFT_31779 [Auriculariopsis ampla]
MATTKVRAELAGLAGYLQALHVTCEKYAPRPIPATVETQMVSQILVVLNKRRPLQRTFQEPPPTIPYTRFVSRKSNREHIQQIDEALHCVTRLFNLSDELGRPELLPFDTAFFASTFSWIEFLLPMCRSVEEVDALPPDCDVLTLDFTMAALDYLQAFTHLFLNHRDRVHEIFMAVGQRVPAIYVNVWMHWMRLYDPASGVSEKSRNDSVHIVRLSLRLLPTLWIFLENSDVERAMVISEILRAVRNHPNRFFRRFAQYMRVVIEHPVLGGDNDAEAFVRTLLRGLIDFSDAPGLGMPGRLPTKLALTMIDVVDHYLTTEPEGVTWQPAWDVCATVCMRSTKTIVRAMEKGIFALTVRVRMTVANALHLDRMIIKIQMTASMPRAIRAFHATLPLVPPSVTYEFVEERAVNVFERRYYTRQALDTSWELAQTCCNAACPMSGGEAGALRSCACGEALYCSKTCQRAHWTEGGHREVCTNDKRSDPLTARKVIRFVSEMRGFVQERYADYRPDTTLHVGLHDGEKRSHVVSETRSESPDVVPAPVVVELRIERAWGARTLRMLFSRNATLVVFTRHTAC